jgi:CBS domain-containing protein
VTTQAATASAAATARDVMTNDLVTVGPEMPVAELAALLAGRGVSGAPVVDGEGALLGVVTESDLLRRLAAGGDRPPGWLGRLFADSTDDARRYARAHGQRAGDLMTRELATVGPDTPVADIARLFEARDIRRVPVVEGGRLLGVVSRADLLRAILAPPPAETPRADAAIRVELHRRLREQPWVDRNFLHAAVSGGVVTLSGFARNEDRRRALRVLAEGVPGVREVRLDLAPPPPFMLGMG